MNSPGFDRARGPMNYRELGLTTWSELRLRYPARYQIRSVLRGRDFTKVLPGVFVNHTGPLTAEQRTWATLLWATPAALCGPTLFGAGPDEPVHVAITQKRRLVAPPWIVLHRVTHLEEMVRRSTWPPRLAIEHNVLLEIDLAPDEAGAIALLTGALGRLGTTAGSVRRALDLHPTMRWRALILDAVSDAELGVESVLERGYLSRVERPHGLPTPTRQALRADGRERRDMAYEEFGLIVELDGRLNHASWEAGGRDAARDLADIASGQTVLRLRWRQVMESPCATAELLAAALRHRGWSGTIRKCPRC